MTTLILFRKHLKQSIYHLTQGLLKASGTTDSFFFSSITWFHGFCLLLVSILAWGGRPIKLSLKTYAALSLLFICSPQRHTGKYFHGRKRNQNQQELKLDTSLFSGKLNPFLYLYKKNNIIYSTLKSKSWNGACVQSTK